MSAAATPFDLLPEFKTWLVEERKVKKSSANVYVSAARSLLRAVGSELTSERLLEVAQEHVEWRYPYRLFWEFSREGQELTLPELPPFPPGRRRNSTREEEGPQLPESVLDALVRLTAGAITERQLSKLYCGHLVHVPEKQRYECPTPGDKGTWTVLEEAPVQVLLGWAAPIPGDELYTPLVPKKPADRQRADWKWIELSLEVRRRAQRSC